MKAIRIHGAGDLRLHDEPVPVPASGDALLRVAAVGVCGSDLHWFSEGSIGDATLARPLILGHEFSATLADGTLVAVDPALPCGECEYCHAGHPNLCPRVRFAGHASEDGALRESMAWPRSALHALPESLDAIDGAMLEPLGVAIHALDLAKVRPGMVVGVFGCGTIGLLVLQMARVAGAASVLVSEPRAHRLAAAERLGGHAWNRKSTVDIAIDCSGSDGAVDDAVAAVRIGGRVILVGIPDSDRTSFTASVARRKGLTLKVSRRMKHTYPRAIELVTSGQVDVRGLVTHCFPLERAAEAFAVAQRREGIKVIIQP